MTSSPRPLDRYRWTAVLLIAVFWILSAYKLDRAPQVQQDEPWILSPGYKLQLSGIYGSDLFSGFNNMEKHYFEFMPLMSLLQALAIRLFGLGVLQMRWLPIAAGALTLALTFRVASVFGGRPAAVLAVLLMLVWQWRPAGLLYLTTGVPIFDIARIARYDILVAPLGLGSLLAFYAARSGSRPGYAVLSGLLAGLAGLAHLYGLFWLAVLVLVFLVDRRWFAGRADWAALALLLGAALTVLAVWGGVILLNWRDFVGQTAQYGDRFSLLDPRFYLANLLNEPHRYSVGYRSASAFGRLGFWLLALGLPASLAWLGWRAARGRDQRALWLLAPCLVLPLLLALLIRVKTFGYLIVVIPLFAAAVGAALARLSRVRGYGRLAAALVVAAVGLQGGLAVSAVTGESSRVASTESFYQRLRQAVPRGQRILGPPQYWLALPESDYRSLALPFFMANPQFSAAPLGFDAAIQRVSPGVLLLDSNYAEYQLNYGAGDWRPGGPDILHDYLRRHHARLSVQLLDNYGQPFEIYQLN